MKVFSALFLVSAAFLSANSFASDKNPKDAASCIVYFQKQNISTEQAHFAFVCENGYYMKQVTGEASQMGDIRPLENALKSELQNKMGMDRGTVCKEYDNKDLWFTSCVRPSLFSN